MIKLNDTTLNRLLSPYGLGSTTVKYLGGGREDSDGVVYSYRQGSRAMVVKIMAWKESGEDFLWTRRRYEERIQFAFFLGRGGASIVNPVPDGDGLLYRHSHDGEYGYISYLMNRVEGRNLPVAEWDDAFIGKWGGAVGRMHALASRYDHWQHSPQMGKDGTPQLGWRNEVHGFRDWCNDPDIKQKWTEIENRLADLPAERACFGFIHNDPHSYNILYGDGNLHVIDFDVANYHWFATDIAIALQTILFDKGGMERPLPDTEPVKQFLCVFLEAYEKEHHLEKQWLDKLDMFVSYRRMLLFTVMQDWLATDDAAKMGWKRMILEEPQVIVRCL